MDVGNALVEVLRLDLAGQAKWRRNRAKEYPDDKRHLKAALIFDRLVASVTDCPDTVILAWHELFDDAADSEAWMEMLLHVGFALEPKNAEQLLRDYIADRVG